MDRLTQVMDIKLMSSSAKSQLQRKRAASGLKADKPSGYFSKQDDLTLLKAAKDPKYRSKTSQQILYTRIARELLPMFSAKQIRGRFCRQIDPRLSFKPWTDKDKLLQQAVKDMGFKWCDIARTVFSFTRSDAQLVSRYKLLIQKADDHLPKEPASATNFELCFVPHSPLVFVPQVQQYQLDSQSQKESQKDLLLPSKSYSARATKAAVIIIEDNAYDAVRYQQQQLHKSRDLAIQAEEGQTGGSQCVASVSSKKGSSEQQQGANCESVNDDYALLRLIASAASVCVVKQKQESHKKINCYSLKIVIWCHKYCCQQMTSC